MGNYSGTFLYWIYFFQGGNNYTDYSCAFYIQGCISYGYIDYVGTCFITEREKIKYTNYNIAFSFVKDIIL